MASIEYCREHADALALEVGNSWLIHYRDGREMPANFKVLFDAAENYCATHQDAELEVFCKACKEHLDKAAGASRKE